MANAIQSVFQKTIHVLDRFHLIHFFTVALRRRRRYLNEVKKHQKLYFIDRCLTRCPSDLTAGEIEFVAQWLDKGGHVKHLYQALQHIRYVFNDIIQKPVERAVQTVSISCLWRSFKNR
ncbi:hypothetical protein CON94_26455 [Bacillus pseudomycoides]|uniref:transposase n=1 Tax=Bacillus pseudomycoides TaxID=64104 RepID=UPI000BEB5E3C|nr:transposase [Bacillus pseudomycoides]PEF72422.1 hypothetical protein CON94_26455 [Bacillus pseudomycoides]PEL85537.1 hypothetical protein CN615_17770 [Bacillus pseudomycoides]